MDFVTALKVLLAKLKPEAYSNIPLSIVIDNNSCELFFKELSCDMAYLDLVIDETREKINKEKYSDFIVLKTRCDDVDFISLFAEKYSNSMTQKHPLDFNKTNVKYVFSNISINLEFIKKSFSNVHCKTVDAVFDNNLQSGEFWFKISQ